MSCSCPEGNNDWGGRCLYETISELRSLVLAADGTLSLLYHRAENVISWSSIGGAGFKEDTNRLIGDLRKAWKNSGTDPGIYPGGKQ